MYVLVDKRDEIKAVIRRGASEIVPPPNLDPAKMKFHRGTLTRAKEEKKINSYLNLKREKLLPDCSLGSFAVPAASRSNKPLLVSR